MAQKEKLKDNKDNVGKKEKIKGKHKKIIAGALASVAIGGGAIGGIVYGVMDKDNTAQLPYTGEVAPDYVQANLESDATKSNEEISYHMVSTGSGLSSFLKLNTNKAIIFDTGIGGMPTSWRGAKQQGNMTVVNYLKSLGIEIIEAIFLSHFHTDHYSNLRAILHAFPVNRVIPNISYDKWNKEFGDDFKKMMLNLRKQHQLKLKKQLKIII